MTIRTAFCKKDQDELASFLARHPGPRSGNSLYQEFAKTHTNHPWQSWRAHYLNHTLIMDAAIRRKQREMREKQTSPVRNQKSNRQQTGPIRNQNHDDRSGVSSSEIESVNCQSSRQHKGQEETHPIEMVELDDYQSSRQHKGKGKLPPVEVIEIDSDLNAFRSSGAHPASHRQPQEFLLRRISSHTSSSSHASSNSKNYPFSNQVNPIYSNPMVPIVTMSPEEEQSFFNFISRYPQGDLRLSLKLYENYHLQAPKFSPREYLAYYLSHHNKVPKLASNSPASGEPTEVIESKVNEPDVVTSVEASNTTSQVAEYLSRSPSPRVRGLTEFSNDSNSEIGTLSVSTGSEDELELDCIFSCSNCSELANAFKTTEETIKSLIKLQDNVFEPLKYDVSALVPVDSKVIQEPKSSDQLLTDPTPQLDTQKKADDMPSPIIPEKKLTDLTAEAINLTEAEFIPSVRTSRTNSSFKPAESPRSVQEAYELVGIFLTDFGDLYTPSEAVDLYQRCGDWALMFEVATLKRLEQLAKKKQKETNIGMANEPGEEEELDPDYVMKIQSMVWTNEEDELILQISSSQADNLSEKKKKLAKLIAKRGIQAVKNRKAFLLPIYQSMNE